MLQHRELLMPVDMTIRISGMSSQYPAHCDIFNENGLMGLAIQIEDQDGTFTEATGTATLRGELIDGNCIKDTVSICIVP